MNRHLRYVKLRTVIESKRFHQDLEKLDPNARRTDKFLRAIDIALAKNTEIGKRIYPVSSIYGIPINEYANSSII